MAFPYIFNANNELGTTGDWASETDTASQLDIVNYVELGRYPWSSCAPYSGAYDIRVVLSGGTADAFLKSSTIAQADTNVSWYRFPIWFSPTFGATADDTFAILELQGAASAVTVSFGGKVTAATGDLQLGIGAAASAAVPATFMVQPLQRGVWYTVELKVDCETNATGTVDMYVTRDGDPQQIAAHASLTAKTNIAITAGVLGIQDQLATTTGVMLIGDFVQDDGQLYVQTRYRGQRTVLKSGHMFVGPGSVEAIAILSTGSSDTVKLWDTDRADVTVDNGAVVELAIGAQTAFSGPMQFQRGCYVQMSGTNPRASIIMDSGDRFQRKPWANSDTLVRSFAKGR